MAELLSTFIDGARPGLRKIVFEEDERLPREYSMYTKSDSTSLAFELLQTYAAFPPAVPVPEATQIPEFDRVPGFQKKVTPTMWGLKTRHTIQEIYTRQYAVLKDYTRFMVASFRYAEEIEAARIFNEGFVATGKTSADGKPFFATDHPREDGGAAQANRPTAHLPLSPNNLLSEIIQFHYIKSGRGNVMPITGNYTLCIPPGLMFIAKEILQSSGKAYTADNTKNVIPEMNVEVLHYIENQNQWFLMHPDHDYTFWRRIPMQLEVEKEELQVCTRLFGEFVAEGVRWRHWRGVPTP